MDGMVGTLMAMMDDLRLAVDMTRASPNNINQLMTTEMHRARRTHQQTIAVKQTHAEFINAAIGLQAGFMVFAAIDECRWIKDNDVKALAFLLECSECFEGIALQRLYARLNTVERGVAHELVEGFF